jgi:ankyrin repeat protein
MSTQRGGAPSSRAETAHALLPSLASLGVGSSVGGGAMSRVLGLADDGPIDVAGDDTLLRTPLEAARSDDHVELLDSMLTEIARRDQSSLDDTLNLALREACMYGAVKCAKILLEWGADENARGENDKTLLHVACVHGRVDCVELLLETGADPNAREEEGPTPLHAACKYAAIWGDVDCVKLLLKWGADAKLNDEYGRTPLHVACILGHEGCVALLLQAGADPNARDLQNLTPLHCACQRGRSDVRSGCVASLLQAGANVDARDDEDNTPLHVACRTGSDDCATLLLQAGANVNARGPKSDTPLHRACDWGNEECVELLLRHGADVNAVTTDAFGRLTPLHVACDYTRAYANKSVSWKLRFTRFGCGRLLVSSGASLEQRDLYERTPVELLCLSCRARQARPVFTDREKLARLLLERGPPPSLAHSRGRAGPLRLHDLLSRAARPLEREQVPADGRRSLAWTADTHDLFEYQERRAVEGALRALLLAEARRAGCALGQDAAESVLRAAASL